MKRLIIAIMCTLSWAFTWADSPLTSTHFAESYNEHPMVQQAFDTQLPC